MPSFSISFPAQGEFTRLINEFIEGVLDAAREALIAAAESYASALRTSQRFDDVTGTLRRSFRVLPGSGLNVRIAADEAFNFLDGGYTLYRGGQPVRYVRARRIADDAARRANLPDVFRRTYRRAIPQLNSRMRRASQTLRVVSR